MTLLPQVLLFCLLMALVRFGAAATLPGPEAEQLFVRRIQPLLQQKCLACHGRDEDKIKGGLDLRTPFAAQTGGDSGKPALVAGQPEASPLFLAVGRAHDDWAAMPPKENDALTAEEVAYLKDWIAAGVPWPDGTRVKALLAQEDRWSATDGVPVKTSGGLSDEWTQRRYKAEDLWAYQPLKKPAVPTAIPATSAERRDSKKENPIDAFVSARLAAAQLTPAPRADRRTLLRRATFDLTGLPPTAEEIEAFVSDPAPEGEAFRRVVERLLASPHYGEQWGRHWLDVVRYADSSGFANDYARGSAWRYRDYVVRAFNTDKPFDRFIREQIAGDELAPADPEAIIATGFLRMGAWELTGMEVPKIARQRFLDDVTDSVGQAFLGHMLQCARCHDHKFDPVPTRDYYSFQAAFATTQLAERKAGFLPVENTSGFDERRYLEQREEHYHAELRRIDAVSMAAARAWYAEKRLDPAIFEQITEEIVGQANRRGRDAGYTEIRGALQRRNIPEDQIPPRHAGLSEEDLGKERVARKGLERLKWEFDRYEPMALSVYAGRTPDLKSVLAPLRMPAARTTAGELEQTHILTGGDPFANGAPVTPAVLSAPTTVGKMSATPTIAAEVEGRRRAVADWIASPDNPLTARVAVNRIWLWHFGTALAGNPNNVGATGKKPTHPELLDWLAATFVEQGWSMKALHRLIMASAAYCRASAHPEPKLVAEKDPTGTSYAVFKPRRLAAEELRDAMLRVTGELNPAIGGIPVRPEINREAAFQSRQVMGTFAEAWQPSPRPEQRHRRTLYALKIRGQPDPFLEVFNAPSPDLSCEARDASLVTPQAFSLFNSEATLARATAWAARLARESSTREQTIARAYALAFGRAPRAAETKASLAHWDAMTARHRTVTVAKPAVPREVARQAVEENTGTKFTFKEPLEAAADFVPGLHLSDLPPETRGLAELCLVLLNANEFAYVY